jgi:hypothetical protein
VAAEEKILGGMEAKLKGLKDDFQATAKTAKGLFSFLGFGGREEEVLEVEPLSHLEPYGRASQMGSVKGKLSGIDTAGNAGVCSHVCPVSKTADTISLLCL